ncbi:MAG: QueT transporter family protein [Candidatus Bathyarchaeota archaeon]|nr:QueT transporter family protein [Candidatus Bathyarchaeota archaeon]
MKTSNLSLMIAFAALYTVLVIALAPISFGPIQLRLADCLIPLAALFGLPVIGGVTIGGFLGNAYLWLGPQDVVLGSAANFLAASVIFLLRRNQFPACVIGSFPIGVIVGSYLWTFFPPPDIIGLNIPIWAAMILSITMSSLVAIGGIGYILLRALARPTIISSLKALGLKIYA